LKKLPKLPELTNKPKKKIVCNKVKASDVDWEEVTYQVRETSTPLCEIARNHGINEGTLCHWIKKEGISRDLRKRVRAQTDDELSRIVRHEEVSSARLPLKKKTDKDRITALAKVRATIILSHRKDIKAHRRSLTKMQRELETGSDFVGDIAVLVRKVVDGGKTDAASVKELQQILRRLGDLGNRADILRKLSDTLKTLIALERQAFDLDEPAPGTVNDGDSVEITLQNVYQAISGRSRGLPGRPITPAPPLELDVEKVE